MIRLTARPGRADIAFPNGISQTVDQLHLVGKPEGLTKEIMFLEGGFLGLDNIGVFDRSNTIPGGGRLEQADGTSWMAMYTSICWRSRWNCRSTIPPKKM